MTNTIAPSATSASDLVPTASRLEPVRPMPLHEVQRAMSEYQAGLQAILNEADWQVFTAQDGSDKRFVKRTGWRKIATWFGLDLLIDSTRIVVERDEQGEPLRARIVARVIAPNGRMAEDVGACSITERRFSKPEHDLVSTAATRALNRATSDLVGMGDLSAEEMGDAIEPLMPEWAHGASDELVSEMLRYLEEQFGPRRALDLANGINARYGCVPNVVAGLVRAMYRMSKETDEQPPEPSTPEGA